MMKKIIIIILVSLTWPGVVFANIFCVDKDLSTSKKISKISDTFAYSNPAAKFFEIEIRNKCRYGKTKVSKSKYKKLLNAYNSKSNYHKNKLWRQKNENKAAKEISKTSDSPYKWNGKIVSREVYCDNAIQRDMPKYYPDKFNKLCVVLPEEEKKRIAEEKRVKEQKLLAEKKKNEDARRKAEIKRIKDERERKEQEYRILVQKYGDKCKNKVLGSPDFNKCLFDKKSEEEMRVKLEREYLETLSPEERRAYTCTKTFGFKKGSGDFKDCIFKLYTTELELQKLDLEKQLALALVEAEKAKAETARAQVETIQARAQAAKAEGKLQQAQIEATNAQTYVMQQQAAAAKQQAAAAQAQAKSIKQQNSINLMMQGLQMMSGSTTSSGPTSTTSCRWVGAFFQCK